MGKNLIIKGADFSANAIASESANLVNINLTDGHTSLVWKSADQGQTYFLYTSTGGWAATDAYSVGSYNKLRGTLSFYNNGNSSLIPPVVFLDSENQFLSAYVPSNPSVGSGYLYADIDIDIPLGASKVLLQVFTGDLGHDIFFTSACAYMYK